MEKGIEASLATIFESLVDLRVLLDCIGWHRTEEYRDDGCSA